jgi:predicted GNAT family N-acyltransferase
MLRGPGVVTMDLALAKNFPIAGRTEFQLRVEAFNVLNHANLNNPNATFGTANFGRITSAQPMRQMQIGAKLMF